MINNAIVISGKFGVMLTSVLCIGKVGEHWQEISAIDRWKPPLWKCVVTICRLPGYREIRFHSNHPTYGKTY